jgi:membrane protein
MTNLIRTLYLSIVKMVDHDGVEHSGYMSFMLLVSIFPFFIFLLAFTSFLGASELGENFIALAIENMPKHSVDSIKTRMSELMKDPPQGLLTLAVLGTIWTSSSFVECLRTILNRVYEVKSPPNYIWRRLLSVFQFLIISFIAILATFIFIALPISFSKVSEFITFLEGYETTMNIVRYTMICSSLFLSVFFLYYLIPNTKLSLLEILPGSILTVLLWMASGYLLSKYIVYYHQLSIIYGSLGSIILTLMFFYIMNMIFIIGAEFNYLLKQNLLNNIHSRH